MKEPVYKVWSRLTGRWLGFEGAQIRLCPEAGSFAVRLRAADPGRLATLSGRFAVVNGIIAPAATLALGR